MLINRTGGFEYIESRQNGILFSVNMTILLDYLIYCQNKRCIYRLEWGLIKENQRTKKTIKITGGF